jgi:hypothetical protein
VHLSLNCSATGASSSVKYRTGTKYPQRSKYHRGPLSLGCALNAKLQASHLPHQQAIYGYLTVRIPAVLGEERGNQAEAQRHWMMILAP